MKANGTFEPRCATTHRSQHPQFRGRSSTFISLLLTIGLLWFTGSTAEATIIGDSIGACVADYATCVATPTPGTNAGGTLNTPVASVDASVEFEWISGSGNSTFIADFDDGPVPGTALVQLSIRNENCCFNVTGPDWTGWVFTGIDDVIDDFIPLGGNLGATEAVLGSGSVGVNFDAFSIPVTPPRIKSNQYQIVFAPPPAGALSVCAINYDACVLDPSPGANEFGLLSTAIDTPDPVASFSWTSESGNTFWTLTYDSTSAQLTLTIQNINPLFTAGSSRTDLGFVLSGIQRETLDVGLIEGDLGANASILAPGTVGINVLPFSLAVGETKSISFQIAPPFVPRAVPPAPGSCDEGAIPPKTPGGGLVLVTHGWRILGTLPPSWHTDMKSAIEQSISANQGVPEDWNVFACTWSGGSPPQADVGTIHPEFARYEAIRLGRAIGQQIATEGYTRVHLIAHSAGSWLIQAAIDRMRSLGSNATIHATFLDAYTPNSDGTGAPWSSPMKLGALANNAEHYVDTTLTGLGVVLPLYFFADPTCGRLEAAHNIVVTGDSAATRGHDWPHKWYLDTVLAPGGTAIAEDWGFGLTQEIGEPLDHADFPLGGLSLGTLTACDNSLVTLAVHRVFSAGQTVATLGSVAVDPVANVVDLTIDLLSPLTAQGGMTSAAASSPSPTWVATTVDADSTFNAISFGFEFLSGAGGELSVHFEDEFLFAIEQVGAPATPASETIALESEYPAGTYSIAFRLDSAADSSVRLTDVRLEDRRAIAVPVASWAGRVVLALVMLATAVTATTLRRSRPSAGRPK